MGIPLNIGLDFDGVLGDSHPLKPQIAKALIGVEIPEKDFRKELVVGQGLLTKDQYATVGKEVFGGKYPVFPVKDACFYVRQLVRQGHQLKVITSRSDSTLLPALKCLAQWEMEALPVIGVGYGVSKLDACKDLHVYIDDDLTKLIPLLGEVPHLILFSRLENRHEREPAGIVRLDSWHEIYMYIWEEVRL